MITQNESSYKSYKSVGKVDETEYLVVQRTKNLVNQSEEERHHHYEELVKDNWRMREVLEEMQRELAKLRALNKDPNSLQLEMRALNEDFLRIQSEHSLCAFKSEQLNAEWQKKYELLQFELSSKTDQLKQLAMLQNQVRLYELDAKKRFDRLSAVDTIESQNKKLQIQIQDLEQRLLQEQQKYQQLLNQYNSMKEKYESNNLDNDIEALIHEVKQWKMRYQSLLNQIQQNTSSKDYELTISQLKSQLQNKDLMLSQVNKSSLEDQLRALQQQLDDANSQLEICNHEKLMNMQEEIWKLQMEIDQMNQDIGIFVAQIKQLKSENESYQSSMSELTTLREKVNSSSSRYKQVDFLEKQLKELQAELEIWKNRYFQTEIRLKEYDKLKEEYDKLRRQGSSSSSVEVTTLKSEITRLTEQIRIYESQRFSNSNNFEVQNLRNERDQLKQQLTEFRSQQVTFTDSNKIDELNQLIVMKNRQIADLEILLNQQRSTTTRVTVDETSSRRVSELETRCQSLELEIQRLQNIRQEQDFKIQQMIAKITEYESQINIFQEQLKVQKSGTSNTKTVTVFNRPLEVKSHFISTESVITSNQQQHLAKSKRYHERTEDQQLIVSSYKET